MRRFLSGREFLAGHRRFLAGAVALVVVVAGVGAAAAFWPRNQDKHLVAYFPETTGLYTGDKVEVLGVPVGKVDSITPGGGRVRVVLSYAASVRVPAGAQAAIVTPTLVTTRAVQLTPAYHAGPVMADGATIPESRTAVPVEWGQIEQELDTLATALGPHGAAPGALNEALRTSAANLNGKGQDMHDTLTALTNAVSTLSDDRGDLFATLDNLQKFVSVLQQANGQVGSFQQELAAVSGVLADNRQELADTLATLNSSVGTVTGFVQGNRTALAQNLTLLNNVAANLARSDTSLANFLQIAPTEVANFNNIYDPVGHAINSELAVSNLQNPAEFICSTIFSLGGTPAQCQQALGPLVQVLKQDSSPVSIDPVNRDGYGGQASPAAGGGSGSGGGGGLLNLLLGGGGA